MNIKRTSSKRPAVRRQRPSIAREYSSPPCYLHELEAEQGAGQKCDVRIKRIYEKATRADGRRVLVDRLWPRGVRKEAAGIEEWLKDLAPSTELRKWFGHEPSRWGEFQRRYRKELAPKSAEIARLRRLAQRKRLTLLYAARQPQMNHALVLREIILDQKAASH